MQQRAGCDVHKEGERNSTVPMNQPSLRPAMEKRGIGETKVYILSILRLKKPSLKQYEQKYSKDTEQQRDILYFVKQVGFNKQNKINTKFHN